MAIVIGRFLRSDVVVPLAIALDRSSAERDEWKAIDSRAQLALGHVETLADLPEHQARKLALTPRPILENGKRLIRTHAALLWDVPLSAGPNSQG